MSCSWLKQTLWCFLLLKGVEVLLSNPTDHFCPLWTPVLTFHQQALNQPRRQNHHSQGHHQTLHSALVLVELLCRGAKLGVWQCCMPFRWKHPWEEDFAWSPKHQIQNQMWPLLDSPSGKNRAFPFFSVSSKPAWMLIMTFLVPLALLCSDLFCYVIASVNPSLLNISCGLFCSTSCFVGCFWHLLPAVVFLLQFELLP